MGQMQKNLARTNNLKGIERGILGFLYVLSAYIQMTLFLALFTVMALTIGTDGTVISGYRVFFVNLIIVIPVVSTQITEKKCKGFISYLIINIISVVIMLLLYRPALVGNNVQNQAVVYIMQIIESFFLIWDGIRRRIQAAERKELFQTADVLDAQLMDSSLILQPGKVMFGIFVAIYFVGVMFGNPFLSNIALVSTVLYYVCAKYYIWYEEVQNYIQIHKRVANRPDRRIIRITGAMLSVFLLGVCFFSLFALATTSQRHYMKVRANQWKPLSQFDIYKSLNETLELEQQFQLPNDMIEQAKEPTIFDKVVFVVIAIITMTGIMVLVINTLRGAFRGFREGIDDNGDIVEDLKKEKKKEDPSDMSKEKRKKRKPETERERIRFDYIRLIRKSRKELPNAFETPHEIEKTAGLLEGGKKVVLHDKYEWARYSKE